MPVSDSATINEISRFVYQAILKIQQQQPELLQEKYRKVQWSNAHNQSIFLEKLKAELSNAQGWEARLLKVRRILQAFLIPNAIETSVSSNLLQTIRAYIQRQAERESHRSSSPETPELDSSPSSLAKRSPGIAILLLDAENLQLNPETEKFLAGFCTYPIQIKIAFANWRNMGKQDAEYHGRGYELIHVPPGKDSADVKMATVGSSIFVHYPTAREVLVCSSDGVMTHLCTTLQTHGLTVYRVRRQGDTITVFNSQTGQTQTHSLNPPPDIPSIEQFITQIKELIRGEQVRTGNFWIKLARLSSLFQSKYRITISQVVSVHFPGKRARDIFIDFPTDFVVHQLPSQSELYVTLFEINHPNPAAQNHSARSTEAPLLLKIETKADLGQVLVRIVEALTAKSPGGYVPISNVATEFQKQYALTITSVMRRLQLASKFPQVLQSFGIFKLKKVEKVYHVAVRSDAITLQTPHAEVSNSPALATLDGAAEASPATVLPNQDKA